MNADLCERAKEFLKLYSEAIEGLGLTGLMYHTSKTKLDGHIHISGEVMQEYFGDGEWKLEYEPNGKDLKYYELSAYYNGVKFIVLLTQNEYEEYLNRLADEESNENTFWY